MLKIKIPENWAEKPPPPPHRMGEIFFHWIYPFHAISSTFGCCGRKAPPTQWPNRFFRLDLSISSNFQQLWFLWQKSPPPPTSQTGKNFRLDLSIHAISSNFGSAGRKAPPSNKMRTSTTRGLPPITKDYLARNGNPSSLFVFVVCLFCLFLFVLFLFVFFLPHLEIYQYFMYCLFMYEILSF